MLSFPSFSSTSPTLNRLKNSENTLFIFDSIRKKFVTLQPEEWVRQHCISYLTKVKKYPKPLINVEKKLVLHNLTKRYDIIVFNTDGSILLIVECKSPKQAITQDTFDQIARYNLALNAKHLMLTNGLQHYYYQIDVKNKRYHFLENLPAYGEI